jgi:Glycosyltransferase family 9 (heptosyltransferase)
LTGGRTFLAPVSYGLGDLVVSLPALQALVLDASPVWLVARAPSQRLLASRIAGLAGSVDESSLACGRDDRLFDLRDHPLQRDYWWGSPAFEAEFGDMNINDILERICADLGIDAHFDAPLPLQAEPRTGLSGTVLLVHETDGSDKEWPVDRWAALAELLRAEGHAVAQVTKGDSSSPLDVFDVPALVVPTPGDAVDVISGSRAVVGVDTGLTHIAVQQGKPTVTICRRSSVYVRPWPHCMALRGARCSDACTASDSARAYNRTVGLRGFQAPPRSCPSGSLCLAGTRPEQAVDLLRELL